MDVNSLYRLYRQNLRNAKKRGIEYSLTFKAWLDAWGEFILDENRGVGDKRLRLERIDKCGGYCVGNVHLATQMMPRKK